MTSDHLWSGNEKEAGGEKEPLECGLCVAELDAVEVKDGLTIRKDERVQRQDFEHLQGCDQRAATLLDDVADAQNRGILGGEGRGNARISQTHNLSLFVLLHLLQQLLQLRLAGSLQGNEKIS